MSKIKAIIYIISFIYILTQSNYPIIPNPGYDTITIIPVFGKENKNISEIPKTQMENTISIMTNNSITVNTTNISPQCTLECYTGCRILFPEYIEQKFCVTNFCKCKIIEKNVSLSNTNLTFNNLYDNSSMVGNIHSTINKYGVTQYLDISKKFLAKKRDNYFYIVLYFIIFCFAFGYEFIIFKYIENINDFSFKNWMKNIFDIKFKKYRVNTDKELDDINNDIKELQRCLI